MRILIGRDYHAFSVLGASYIADFIRANPGRLLCFAGGDTPLGIYKVLIEMQARGEVDLNSMYYVGLDEWVGIGHETKGSCAQVMQDGFYGPAGIDPSKIRVFDGLCLNLEQECAEIHAWIAERGKIALTLLGIGMNGHIGFNEPFVDPSKETLVVDLDETTVEVGQKYFNDVACPAQGITVGIKRLIEADEVILAACGPKKSGILKRTLTDTPSIAVPSTLMQEHEALTIVTDKDAFRGMWREDSSSAAVSLS